MNQSANQTNMKVCSTSILMFLLYLGCISIARSQGCKPVINWAPSISFCNGNSIILNATNPNCTYLWSTSANTPTITVNKSGIYWVTVTNSCGSTSDTIQVYVDNPINVNLGPDKTVCSLNSPVLTVPYSPSATYRWQDNSTSNQIAVTQSGQYHVRVVNSCGTYRDTVNIILESPPNLNLGPDINLCNSNTHSLSIPAAVQGTFLWSTGSVGSAINVSQTGDYWVRVKNKCGTFYDTIHVGFNQGSLLDIGDTIPKCNTGTAVISSNIKGGSYFWSNNATTSSITVSNPGTYWLRYTDNCGIYYDTAYVVNTGKALVNLGSDTSLCRGDVLSLKAGKPGNSYLWSTGAQSPSINITKGGNFWVQVNNGCGWSYDSINIELLEMPLDSIGDSAFFCTGGFIDVDAKNWGSSSYYLWDDGSSGRTHRYSTPGSHWVEFGNLCDTLHVDFYVKGMQHKPFDLGEDTAVCGPFRFETNLSSIRNEFRWSDGTDSSYTNATQSGIYWVEVTNACGVFTDTVKVEIMYPPKITTKKTVLCGGDSIKLMATPDTLTNYLWSTGDTTKSINVSAAGKYYLWANNKCDTVVDSIFIHSASPINFSLGRDTVICAPDTVILSVFGLGADSVYWSTGSNISTVLVTKSGNYRVELYNACGIFTDTIDIQVKPQPGGKLSNQKICIGDSVVLDAYQSFIQAYRWSTNETTSSITVSQQGWYYVDLLSDCGWVTDSVFVQVDQPMQPINLGNDTAFCQGSIVLDPGHIPGATYLWQNFSQTRTITANVSGKYYVTVSNACNSYSDTINVLITGPPKMVLGDTVRFCDGSIFTLNAQNPGSTYLWNDGSSGQYLATDTAGIYWVTIENPCGKLTDTVQLITDKPLTDLNLGNDTIICSGDFLILDTKYPKVMTRWGTGHSGQQYVVSQTGTYWVELFNTCGSWSDTIFVQVEDVPVFSLGPDSVICAIDGQFDLKGPPNMQTYKWNNGSTDSVLTTTQSGYHWLTVANHCFEYTDTIYLKEEYPIAMDLGKDTVLCFGQTLWLNPGVTDYKVRWNGNYTGPIKEVTRSGQHWAMSRNSCGVFTDTINVLFDFPVDPFPIDTIVCDGDSAVFDLRGRRFDVVWSDGSSDQRRAFGERGSYFANLTNKCGSYDKEFVVDLYDCNCPLHVPNTFTPNGDGKNDEFLIGYHCDLVSYEIHIFNRWGEVVFHSTSADEKWRGRYGGKDVPNDVFNYHIYYEWRVYDVVKKGEKNGVVNVIR